jgi:SAM-dependent methyltransferase
MAASVINRPCPLCGGSDVQHRKHIPYEYYGETNTTYNDRLGRSLYERAADASSLVSCCTCGFIFADNILIPELMKRLYNDVIDLSRSWKKCCSEEKIKSRSYICSIIKGLPLQCDARILDVGCGWGDLLRDLNALGYENTVGVEMSHRRQEEILKHGGAVFDSLKKALRHGPFDLILAVQFLEHDPECLQTLRILNHALSASGYLYACVPNAQHVYGTSPGIALPNPPDSNVNPLEHVNYFAPEFFLKALHLAGFEPVHFNSLEPLQHMQGTSSIARKRREAIS